MGRELAPSHMINPISPMVTYFFKLNCSACAVNSRAALWTLTVMSHPCHTPNIHKVTFISEKINIFTYWFFSSSAKIESEKRSSEQNGASDPFQRLELIETPRCPQVEWHHYFYLFLFLLFHFYWRACLATTTTATGRFNTRSSVDHRVVRSRRMTRW